MKTSVVKILHQEKDWLRELDFYKQELGILGGRIEEVSLSNSSSTDILALADQFLNRFTILRNRLDEVRHNINIHIDSVSQVAIDKPTHIHENFLTEDDSILTSVKSLIQDIADIRFELNTFLSKISL